MKKSFSENKNKEASFHIVKRSESSFYYKIFVYFISIVSALVLSAIVTVLVTNKNPLDVFRSFIAGAFGTKIRLLDTFENTAYLLAVALAVTPAFKMRFWNIGAEGQVLVGGLATAAVMLYFGDFVSTPILIIIMIVVSILAGVVWAFLPAVFKAYFNTNETLFTLMMNYIAIQLIQWFLKIADPSGSNTVGPSLLKNGWLPRIDGESCYGNLIIVALLTVFIYVYLRYGKHGYEIAVVGGSENTARYVGIDVKKVTIRTMVLSGAICGFIGLMLVAGTSHSISTEIAGGRGFTAIIVSWLSQFNPLYMIFSSLLIVFLQQGAVEVSTTCGLNTSFSDIITGIILFFIIGGEFFIRYKIKRNSAKQDKIINTGVK